MAQETLQGARAQAQEGAQQAKEQVQEKAQEAKAEARSTLRDQVGRRSTEAGEQARSMAQALRTAGDQLESDNGTAAKAARQAAERVERVGGYLAESDADRILGDVEDFARRNPWAVALGGLAVGFAAARMLRASSTDRYERQRSLPRTGGTSSNGHGAFEESVPAAPPRAESTGPVHPPATELPDPTPPTGS